MRPELASENRSPRILIVRLSAIGDTILTMPLLNALRDRFPQALLAWVVEQKACALLEGHEALDTMITVPKGFLKSPRILWGLRGQLRAMRLDVAIDTQGLTKSAVVGWLSGARRRIGLAGQWGRELSRWLNRELVLPKAPHMVDRTLELLRPLGIERPVVQFRVPQSESEREQAAGLVKEAGLENGFAIINPGAGWPSRLWPAKRFAAVARHLGERWSLPSLVVWAGSMEMATAEWIAGAAEGHAQLAPPTSLRQLASLARLARLFVSSDTGPLHLAVAVGTPCVGLHGPWPAEQTGPYGPQHIAVEKMVFNGTTRQRRFAPRQYMESIDVPSVCEACDRILQRQPSRAA
jgi:ADP-heptose:LPS heptosyltransferase